MSSKAEELSGDLNDNVATTFNLVTSRFHDGPEQWDVRVIGWPDDEPPNSEDILAQATIYRAQLDEDWFDRLDSVDQDLASVAEDFLDRDAIEEIDEEAAFASAISVVDFVTVREDARGHKLSHELVRTLARVLRADIITLKPAATSMSPDGELVEDQVKRRALIRHWQAMGFVTLPNTDTMMLPFAARTAELQS